MSVVYLQRVQPKDLDASEIEVRLGATWIEPHYLDDFMREVFHTPRWKAGYAIQAQYAEVSGVWNITGKSQDSGNPMTNSTYGTDRVNGYKLLEDALNLKNTKIYDIVRDADGEHRVLNKQQTILAQQKQDMIREAFKEWIFKDLARREALCAKYNRLFNAIRPREYDGSHIRFVGMTPAITLMPHQKNAVAHILYGGNTLLAHCVGAGKTFSMIAAGMESRRLGLSQKNLYTRLLKEESQSVPVSAEKDIKRLTIKLDQLHKKRDKLLDHNISGRISDEQYEEMNGAVTAEMEEVTHQINEAKDSIASVKANMKKVDQLCQQILSFFNTYDGQGLDAETASILIDRIEVFPTEGKEIPMKIHLKFNDEPRDARFIHRRSSNMVLNMILQQFAIQEVQHS